MLRFASLASGSGGNCLVVEAGDRGSHPRAARLRPQARAIPSGGWRALGLAPARHRGMLVTHEHGDHARRRVRLRRRATTSSVYLTYGTLRRAEGRGQGDRRRAHAVRQRQAERGARRHEVLPFTVPHDAREPVQFVLSDGDAQARRAHRHRRRRRRMSQQMLSGLDALVLECNYDRDMLWSGRLSAVAQAAHRRPVRASRQPGLGARCSARSTARS